MGVDPAHTFQIFQDLFLVWLVGLIGGLVAFLLRQPLLLGYMLGGLIVSPFTPGPAVQHPETLQTLAEFGVVLLMFSIGLELAPVGLRRIGRLSVVVGLTNMFIVSAAAAAVGLRLGWPVGQAVVVGVALSIASTMVVTKMLMERGELKTHYGQTLIGVTIVEDCVLMVLLLFFPLLSDPGGWNAAGLALVAVKTVALLAVVFTLGVRVVPRLLAWVERAKDPELSVLVLLAIAMGIIVAGVWTGLSISLGAFVAGLVVSGSETTSHTMGRMLPLRDLFVVTFFVSLGILLDLSVIRAHWPTLIALLGAILIGKWVVTTLLVWVLERDWAMAWRIGVGVAQIGEFSLVLCTIAQQMGLISREWYHLIVAASLLSILVNTFVFNLLQKAPAVLSALRANAAHRVTHP